MNNRINQFNGNPNLGFNLDWGNSRNKVQGIQNNSMDFLSNPMNSFQQQQQNPAASWNSREGMFGQSGWFSPTLNAIGGMGSLYMGMRNFGEARRQANVQMDFANRNFDMQANLINETRQRRSNITNSWMNPGTTAPTVTPIQNGANTSNAGNNSGSSNFDSMRNFNRNRRSI